jgi:hypothetical protein
MSRLTCEGLHLLVLEVVLSQENLDACLHAERPKQQHLDTKKTFVCSICVPVHYKEIRWSTYYAVTLLYYGIH